MTKNSGSETVNQGGASDETQEKRDREFEIASNAKERGEKPSPGDRDRGETSAADGPLDLDSAHDRAS